MPGCVRFSQALPTDRSPTVYFFAMLLSPFTFFATPFIWRRTKCVVGARVRRPSVCFSYPVCVRRGQPDRTARRGRIRSQLELFWRLQVCLARLRISSPPPPPLCTRAEKDLHRYFHSAFHQSRAVSCHRFIPN